MSGKKSTTSLEAQNNLTGQSILEMKQNTKNYSSGERQNESVFPYQQAIRNNIAANQQPKLKYQKKTKIENQQ